MIHDLLKDEPAKETLRVLREAVDRARRDMRVHRRRLRVSSDAIECAGWSDELKELDDLLHGAIEGWGE